MPNQSLPDIQATPDTRGIAIDQVGVSDLRYPIQVTDQHGRPFPTVATISMSVHLPHQFKGTHMSRFVEILNRCHGEINLEKMQRILVEMKERLDAEAAHLEIEFPYFLQSAVEGRPPDGGIGVNEYRCRMHGSLAATAAATAELTLAINVPIAPPRPLAGCPGLPRSLGHWGTAEITLRFKRFVWIEEIIELVARVARHDLCWPDDQDGVAAGCDLSVEKMARTLGAELERHPDVLDFTVRVENLAAGFSTFAFLSGGLK